MLWTLRAWLMPLPSPNTISIVNPYMLSHRELSPLLCGSAISIVAVFTGGLIVHRASASHRRGARSIQPEVRGAGVVEFEVLRCFLKSQAVVETVARRRETIAIIGFSSQFSAVGGLQRAPGP